MPRSVSPNTPKSRTNSSPTTSPRRIANVNNQRHTIQRQSSLTSTASLSPSPLVSQSSSTSDAARRDLTSPTEAVRIDKTHALITPPHDTFDFLLLANHVFLIGAVGYVIGNFFRSLLGSQVDTQLSDALSNALFFFLAIVFFVDAILYALSMFDCLWIAQPKQTAATTRMLQEPLIDDDEQFQHLEDGVIVGVPIADTDMPEPTRSSRASSVSDMSNDAVIPPPHIYEHPRPLFPLTIDGWADILNIVASTMNLFSSILPFLSVLLSNGTQADGAYLSWSVWVDTYTMAVWCLDALLFFLAFRQTNPTASMWSAYYMANVANMIGSITYFASCLYGIVLTYAPDDTIRDYLFTRSVLRNQRTCALAGDVLYLICAVLMEVGDFYERKAKWLKHITSQVVIFARALSTGSTSTSSSDIYRRHQHAKMYHQANFETFHEHFEAKEGDNDTDDELVLSRQEPRIRSRHEEANDVLHQSDMNGDNIHRHLDIIEHHDDDAHIIDDEKRPPNHTEVNGYELQINRGDTSMIL